MSRMKLAGLRTAGIVGALVSMGLSGMALLGAGSIDEAMFRRMPKGRSDGRSLRRKVRSRYMPHQGPQECARRLGISVPLWIELHGRNRFMGGARG